MKKVAFFLLGLFILLPSSIWSKEIDNLDNLKNLVDKKVFVILESPLGGVISLSGKIFSLNPDNIIMDVWTISEKKVNLFNFTGLLILLGNNAVTNTPTKLTGKGVLVTFKKSCVLLAEVKENRFRNRFLWILSLGLKSDYKCNQLYVRSDFLNGAWIQKNI